jgi:hypothetical protein
MTTDGTDFTDGFRNLRASVSVQSVVIPALAAALPRVSLKEFRLASVKSRT